MEPFLFGGDMKIIIRGLGAIYKSKFENNDFWFEYFEKNGIEIIAFMEPNTNELEKIILNKRIPIYNSSEFIDCDYIIITSPKYYTEIKEELLKSSYRDNQIVLLEDFLRNYIHDILHIQLLQDMNGIEIGGPSEVYSEIYKKCASCDDVNYSIKTAWGDNRDRFEIEGRDLGGFILADATDLSVINDSTYDFLLSSNNLEHIANPIKALKEFIRIVKPDGYIYIAVPNKKYNFDHHREDTLFEHIENDYKSNVGEDDLTHLEEILEKHDLRLDKPAGSFEDFKKRSLNNFENRCLHHHVFSKNLLNEVFNYINLDVIDIFDYCGNFVVIGQKDRYTAGKLRC